MQENRLTVRLINYWNQLKGVAFLPYYSQFNPAPVSDLMESCFVLEIMPSAGSQPMYRYDYCGQAIKNVLGKDLTGQMLTTSMRLFPGARIIKRIDEVARMEAEIPLLDEGQFVNDKSKIIKYRACMVAFGKEGTVSHILIGVSWREF